MKRRAKAAVLLGLGILWACNEPDPRPPNVTDPGQNRTPSSGGGSSTSGSTTDGGGSSGLLDSGSEAGTVCSALDEPTTLIDGNNVADSAPPGLGGTLIDTTYDLTTAQRYVGASGQPGPNNIGYREVIRISAGNQLERVRLTRQDQGPFTTTNASYVLQVSGTNLTLTQKCPTQGVAETFGYTIQLDGKLTLTSATGESFTYTARP